MIGAGFIDKDSWRIYTKKEVIKHKEIILKLLPHLILKKKQAILMLKALEIWCKPRVRYTLKDFKRMLTLRDRISQLNRGGYHTIKKVSPEWQNSLLQNALAAIL